MEAVGEEKGKEEIKVGVKQWAEADAVPGNEAKGNDPFVPAEMPQRRAKVDRGKTGEDKEKWGEIPQESRLHTRQMTGNHIEKGDNDDAGQHAGNGDGDETGRKKRR